MDCFVAFAPRNDVETHIRIPAARCARVVHVCFAQRGRGECRVPIAPAASRGKNKNHTSVVTTGPPESPGIPARGWFLRLISRSPRGPGFFAPVASAMRKHRRQLDTSVGASGPHDFAVRGLHRSSLGATASTASPPALMTLRNAPLSGQDGASCRNDLPDGLSEIFFSRGLDR